MAVFESNPPLVKHKISLLREDNISIKDFGELTNEIAMMLMVEPVQILKQHVSQFTVDQA